MMHRRSAIKGFIVAGTNSGCGKTTIALGLMALFTHQGYRVAPFKVGPDFIDPGHHTRITGTTSRNLDGWMLSQEYNQKLFQQASASADIAVVEGVMGLYDGYDGSSEAGSTAQMAKWLNLPVILIVNAQSMARSGAALVSGFERFDPDLRFAGVIFNKLGSRRHLDYLTQALEGHVAMPCLGGIYRDQSIAIPERHLGLYTDDDHVLSKGFIDKLASLLDNHVDTTLLAKHSGEDSTEKQLLTRVVRPQPVRPSPAESKVRIGVARDKAFCFYYPDNLEHLQENGAELVYFSPIEDQRLPKNLSGLYFGGGYPELYAEQLAANNVLREEIQQNSQQGMPIFGECGGFMYLCSDIIDLSDVRWPMTGCFPFSIRMLDRLKSLGYREITLKKDTIVGQAGQVMRGHEFHYSEIVAPDAGVPALFKVTPRTHTKIMEEGYQIDRTLGGYLHLHFASNPAVAGSFVSACQEYQNNN